MRAAFPPALAALLTVPSITLLIVLPFAGCLSGADEPHPVAPITLELHCPRAAFAVGEEVPIHVFLRNRAEHAVRIVEPRHNAFGAFANEVSRDGVVIDGHTVAHCWFADPYFYYGKPIVRDGSGRASPAVLTETFGLVDLPSGLEWEGILGSTEFSCGDDSCDARTVYTRFFETGVYTVRVLYRMGHRKKPAYEMGKGWREAVAATPALALASNSLVITVTDGKEKK